MKVGLLWLLMTLTFEFVIGHFVFRTSWEKLLADYDLSRGRIWPLVLLTCLVSPYIAYYVSTKA
jgi:hypothetical protein